VFESVGTLMLPSASRCRRWALLEYFVLSLKKTAKAISIIASAVAIVVSGGGKSRSNILVNLSLSKRNVKNSSRELMSDVTALRKSTTTQTILVNNIDR